MDDQNEHINPWTEKLQELRVPGIPKSWQAMNALLDAEMPVQKRTDGRRWLLLILLLLLLVGVCHYPHTSQISVQGIPAKDARPALSKNDQGRGVENKTGRDISKGLDSTSGYTSMQKIVAERGTSEETGNENAITNKERNGSEGKAANNNKPAINKDRFNKEDEFIQESELNNETSLNNQNQHDPEASVQQRLISAHLPDSLEKDRTAKNSDPAKAIKENKSTQKPIPDTARTKEKTDGRGWAFAIGLNQFFAVGDQQKSNFNADGTSGNISDYVPVPVVRYYFHSWLYMQAEAQINSPQYTKTLLAGQGFKAANLSGQAAVQSVFIKKLFYFNIPVSIHYSPFKHLFLGAGLQYSRLTNGVALFQDTRPNGGFITNAVRLNDTTLIVSKLGNFKHDSAYQELKTNEWRFLLDLNYQWKRATIGLRYNQAFSDFINIRISPVNITQAQNRSLQLYLRYILLDRRKKIPVSKK